MALHNIRRVGLISPCLGNLGNAAILSSMIANVRKRISKAEIVGITLSPKTPAIATESMPSRSLPRFGRTTALWT